MPTAEELRRIAEEAEQEAREAQRARDYKAEALMRRVAMLAREVLEEHRRLRGREQKGNVHDMETEHRVAISTGRSTDPLAKAAQAAGFTMRTLAKKVGVSIALLSMARKGDRSLKRSVAERIERLTGYPVSSWKNVAD